MASTTNVPEMSDAMAAMFQQGGAGEMQPQQQNQVQGEDPTASDPQEASPEQRMEQEELTEEEKAALLDLRREYKQSWAPNRRAKIKEILRAFEVLKGNSYMAFDPDGFQWYDPIASAISGENPMDDSDLFRYNDNIYQMLALSFMAALSAQVPKVRYTPEDANSELDVATADRASKMMAIIEKKNKITSLQKQELLHLWTGGAYFSYSRYTIDADRWSTRKEPITEMVDQEVKPERWECPGCMTETPTAQTSPFVQPMCPQCGQNLDEGDYREALQMPLPMETGSREVPNGFVQLNVYGPMNVDADPMAEDLTETPILDLEVEVDIAAIRAAYPGAWDKLSEAIGISATPEGESDRVYRMRQKTTSGARNGFMASSMLTYSRCWIQPWAFCHIHDKAMAEKLQQRFPNGCKLVSAGLEFLEAVPEKLSDRWTHCGTVRGLGLYPIAVGGAALDVQDRINDVANITHEHMDRNASPTILCDTDAVDGEALNGQAMTPGRITLIKRKGNQAARPLSDVMFQPTFHVDNGIYSYGESLLSLAQLVSGVRPEIFGGSDSNVKTASGQRQMLNQAIGRLALFWDQMREEHADRSENAVRCMANNMGSEVRYVIEGDTASGFENEYILLEEMQGDFHAEAESDEGFPATFGEIRDRLMEMLGQVNNPFIAEVLEDPDNARIVARYLAPPGIKVPGEDERIKIRRVIGELAKAQPYPAQPQEAAAMGIITMAPINIPQTEDGIMLPDPDFDDMAMIVELCKKWGQKNYKQAEINPGGYANVRAYLRLAAQKQSELEMKQALMEQQAGGGAPGEGGDEQGGKPSAGGPPKALGAGA